MLEYIIEIPKTQLVLNFVSTCIEATARLYNVSYKDIFDRMKRVGMIENYIVPNYEALHSQSREILAADMMECLKNWEAKQWNN